MVTVIKRNLVLVAELLFRVKYGDCDKRELGLSG